MRYILPKNRRHIQKYHAGDSEETDDPPKNLEFSFVFFAEEKHIRYNSIAEPFAQCFVMLDFREKKKMRKTMYSAPVLFLLLVILAVSVNATWNLLKKHQDSLQKANEAKAELSKLEAQKSELEKQIAFLQTDRGREQEIRGKFMVEKQGENVIMVIDPKVATSVVPVPQKEPSLWSRFLGLF